MTESEPILLTIQEVPKQWLSTAEAAWALGLSPKALERQRQKGLWLGCYSQIDRKLYWNVDWLSDYLRKYRVKS